MRHRKSGYMWRPTSGEWTDILSTERENLEKSLHDHTLQSGVLSGLEVQQQAMPNLSVLVKKGRGAYRDSATGRATVIELLTDSSLNLSAFLPSGVPVTVFVVAEPLLVESLAITPTNPDIGHPDYDPVYTPTPFFSQERDECVLSVVTAATGQQIVLAIVTLSAGQTSILNTHINMLTRAFASNAQALAQAIARISQLETEALPLGEILTMAGDINSPPPRCLTCDGAAVSRTTYSALFAKIGVAFGVGDSTTTFNLPDLRNKFIMGASGVNPVGATGGANTFTLLETHLPSHAHGITIDNKIAVPISEATDNDGDHGHYTVGSIGSGGSGYNAVQIHQVDQTDDWAGAVGSTGLFSSPPPSGAALGYNTPGYGSEHSHSFSFSIPAHTHTATITATGGGEGFDNRPAFAALAYFIRAI